MKTKRLLSGLCALAMTFTAASQMGLTGIVTSADNELPIIPITSSKFEYTLLSDGTYEVSAYTGSGTSVTVPPRYNGKAVTSIGDRAFVECKSLKAVTIPKSVTEIGEQAFGYYTEGSPDAVYKKVSGFTVTGYKGSAAETYAKDNGFTFTALEEDSTVTIGLKPVAVPDVTDSIFISISVDGKHEATAQGTEIPFKLAEGTHEMTFSAPGFVTRTYTVTVTDGKLTEALTAELRRPGDANADGIVNTLDLMKIKRSLINIEPLTDYDLTVSDIDGKAGLSTLDTMRLKKHLIGIDPLW